MKNEKFKSRKHKLEDKIKTQLLIRVDNTNDCVEKILKAVDEYEIDNLSTIDKLKKEKLVTTKKINGALKQSINAHGPITYVLIGSATKRIYGALLENSKKTTLEKFLKWLNLK